MASTSAATETESKKVEAPRPPGDGAKAPAPAVPARPVAAAPAAARPVAAPAPVASAAAAVARPAPAQPTSAPVAARPAAATVVAAAPAAKAPAPVAAAAFTTASCPIKSGACPLVGKTTETFCDTCGYVWTPGTAPPAASAAPAGTLIKNRYQLGALIKEYGGVSRYKGTDRGNGQAVSVVILRSVAGGNGGAGSGGEMSPGFDVTLASQANGAWPSIAWEKNLLEKAQNPALPKVIDSFTENGHEYLVEESPTGQNLWNAWDDLDSTWAQRWGWLKNVAEALQQLHKNSTIIEGLRPDIVTILPSGQAVLGDLTDLLPLPLPPNPPIRGTHYTAPEVANARDNTDAKADLYSFGAMLYALHLGRELTDQDFEKNGLPKHFIARFPDVHPMYGRLVLKTFLRDPAIRFPTDEAGKKDPTGSQELVDTLEVARRAYGHVRMEIAAWTTTGIVRTGNEDAFTLIHANQSRLDEFSEYSLILLADGMGGYEAGEIAAALCLDTLREKMVGNPQFAAVAGKAHPKQGELDVNALKKFIYDSMKDTNKAIFQAPQKGIGRRGMGCTCEVVYLDGYNIVVGHVGDSRTYQLSQGRMNQITRDQTLVNRLVELGQITQEEAENHPRKNELQQAMGGRADVEPAVYSAKLRPGDWVLVTSDGLINHIKNEEIQEMFQLEAYSADTAARRLVNFANLRGATDNSTVVVVRCT
jgi:protein phosphatase